MRARAKPIKIPNRTNFYSGEKMPYREKYDEFKESLSLKGKCQDEEEFQES